MGMADSGVVRAPTPRLGIVESMDKKFERHRQAWTPAEIGKLRLMVGKGMSLKTVATSLTRSEESVKKQAKLEKLKISKAR